MNRRLNNLDKSNREPIQERAADHYNNDKMTKKERDRSPVEIAVNGVGCSIDELDKNAFYVVRSIRECIIAADATSMRG